MRLCEVHLRAPPSKRNFVEPRYGEVRRIYLLGTRLNRGERKGRDACS
jgi:hypothetical protein